MYFAAFLFCRPLLQQITATPFCGSPLVPTPLLRLLPVPFPRESSRSLAPLFYLLSFFSTSRALGYILLSLLPTTSLNRESVSGLGAAWPPGQNHSGGGDYLIAAIVVSDPTTRTHYQQVHRPG